ncbi:MAG: hypothetical protein AAF222_10085 [Pseudomonadota bacterium]
MTPRSFFETFNLALGRLIAILLGAMGAFLLYLALLLGDMVWVGAIGAGLVLIAAAMLYWRMTLLHILEFFSGGSS